MVRDSFGGHSSDGLGDRKRSLQLRLVFSQTQTIRSIDHEETQTCEEQTA
jgi:hypothetical protein